MEHHALKTRNRHHLLPVFFGLVLLVQAGSAVDCTLDLSTPYHTVFPGSAVTISARVYDTGYPGVSIPNAKVLGTVYSDSGEYADLTAYTNASGWSVITHTPQTPGRYVYTFAALVNYSTIPGLPAAGKQSASAPGIVINVTPLHIPLSPLVTRAPPATATTTTAAPVTTTQAAHTSPVTQAPPALQTRVAVPASQSDTTPPVTTLTLAGTEDGSGGYSSGVTCTLTAADNPGGSGVSVTRFSYDGTGWNTYSQPFPVDKPGPVVLYYHSSDHAGNTEVANVKVIVISPPGAAPAGTPAAQVPAPAATTPADAIPFFPLPLWLVGLIIFVLVAATGGGLYLKSRLKEEQKK